MKPKPDAPTRKRLMVEAAMRHPAKGHIGMWSEIIERYTQPGEWVLDPMAGIGTTLVGCMMGRNVICLELEPHFVEPMLASWRKMQQIGPMLGHEMGQAVILQGDARALPLPDGDVEAAVFSPPYEGSVQGAPGIDWTQMQGGTRDMTKEGAQDTRVTSLSGYAKKPNKLFTTERGRWAGDNSFRKSKRKPLGYGYDVPISAAVFSPPYSETLSHGGGGFNAERSLSEGYDVPISAAVFSPPYEGITGNGKEIGSEGRAVGPFSYTRPDAIVTSPPYEAAQSGGGIAKDGYRGPKHGPTDLVGKRSYMPENVGGGQNIGNLRGAAYWSNMTVVYSECRRILKPGGLLVLVLKGFTRDKQYQDLPEQTRELVEGLGFRFVEKWTRELWSLSFWRLLQAKRDGGLDERLKSEWVYVFQRGIE